jgi:iron complex outermembrane receptor protein
MKIRTGLLVAVSALPLTAFGAPGRAQTPPVAASTETPQAKETENVGDIVVTALRRSQNLQDVPIAVTAVTGVALANAGITGTPQLTQVVPALNFAQQGATAQPTIRGVGSRGTSAGDESNVAIYVDDVYQTQPYGNLFEFEDIEQIEVLKGPQGTLFGRNSMGGAILVTTRRPSQTQELDLSASYGRFNDVAFTAYANTPLSDSAAFNVAGTWQNSRGYIYDVLAKKHQGTFNHSIRTKLLLNPNDDWDILLSANYRKAGNDQGVSYKILNGNSSAPRLSPGTLLPDGYFTSAFGNLPRHRTRQAGGSVTSNYKFGFATLTSITAYTDTKINLTTDNDSTAAPPATGPFSFSVLDQFSKTFTQELRLASTDHGPFEWVVGAFYFNDRSGNGNFFLQGVGNLEPLVRTHAIAGFGELTYHLTDTVSVTGGVRYSDETRRFLQRRENVQLFDVKGRWTAWTPRVIVKYQPNSDLNLYASYSSGFKSGVFNSGAFLPTPVNPEHLDAYETGVKLRVSPNFRVNAAAYYYNYKDIQFGAQDFATGVSRLINAARGRVYGLDADAVLRAAPGLEFTLGFGYTNATYTDFPRAQISVPRPDNLGNVTAFLPVNGNDIIRTPRFTTNLGGSYHFGFANGTLKIGGNLYYTDTFYWEPSNRLKTPAHEILNGQISWLSPDERYELSVSGENLTDARYPQTILTSAFGDQILWAKPITYRVGVKVHFR